jgi:CheY-like chemotaxis protein
MAFIWLPLARLLSRMSYMPSNRQITAPVGSGLPAVILVVEDDWLLRQAMASEMRNAGWRVLEASTGEAALSLPDTAGQIDLVVTDIRLAGEMTGWDVAQGFRSRFSDLPVVYVSGNSVDSARMVSRSTFLGKPCAPSDLMRACRRALEAAGAESSPISRA